MNAQEIDEDLEIPDERENKDLATDTDENALYPLTLKLSHAPQKITVFATKGKLVLNEKLVQEEAALPKNMI